MRATLDEVDFTKSKAFLRSFVKRIEMDGTDVRVLYRLPLPPDGRFEDRVPVLPIDTPGGDRGIRTPDLCDANAALSQLSYIPSGYDYSNRSRMVST
jgi:site-specific DNA recombinase